MTIREYLKKLGATDQELTAKVVQRMEKAMLIDADLEQFPADTVLKIITGAASGLENANGKAQGTINLMNSTAAELLKAVDSARAQLEDLKRQTSGIKDAKINSPETRDAVMAYATVLNATKEIFGENGLEPDVMIAAINAGSYIAWRGIMGPKDPEMSTNWKKLR